VSDETVSRRALPLRSIRLWAIVAVVLLAGTAVAIALLARAERDAVSAVQRRIQNTLRPAQNAEAALLTAYVNQETGQRGYLLTGDRGFLQPYQTGRADAAALQRQLSSLVADDAAQRALLDRVVAAAQRWQTEAAEPEIAARSKGPIDNAQVETFAVRGKQLFDAFRADMGALMARTDTLVNSQLEKLGREQRDARAAIDVTLLLAIVIAGITIALLWYLFARPIARLLKEIQLVAAGDYRRTLAHRGGLDEVRIIAEAVDRMRAGIVEKTAEAASSQQLLTVRQERDRMATDLHDLTIQRIFGLGLALDATATRNPELAQELAPLVDDTDVIIRELRNIIFALGASEDALGVRAGVIQTVRDSARSFGFVPDLDMRGPLDTGLSDELTADVLAVLREALSNAARHSHASSVRVLLSYADDTVNLVVTDDGKGFPEGATPGNGTINLRRRAERRGGRASIRPGPNGGTVVHWWAPVTDVRS
jgi:signal transduction histidine kinase